VLRRRDLDGRGTLAGLDRVEQQAFRLILGKKARDAYDLGLEGRRVVEPCGPGVGEQAAFAIVEWSGAGKRYGWDNHRGVFDLLDRNLPSWTTPRRPSWTTWPSAACRSASCWWSWVRRGGPPRAMSGLVGTTGPRSCSRC
jgi:hypothetical protein